MKVVKPVFAVMGCFVVCASAAAPIYEAKDVDVSSDAVRCRLAGAPVLAGGDAFTRKGFWTLANYDNRLGIEIGGVRDGARGLCLDGSAKTCDTAWSAKSGKIPLKGKGRRYRLGFGIDTTIAIKLPNGDGENWRSTILWYGADGNEIKKDSFITSIMESFEKNFITESRYQLILQGIGTTSIITVLSVIFGSILAFFICLFRRTDSLLANKIANLYVKLLQGTPLVVLLMILYYVVFGKSGISSIWVAVIGFSLNFGAYTSEILRSGIESIDGGQREAALALGYSENQAFFKFIFPQASVRQIPVYRGEIISLLKNTSIVGYIAIQDLTKMSDIIRSRTYEAFFPLIATAIIYFILAWIIALILNLVLKKIDPRAKKARFAKEAAAK